MDGPAAHRHHRLRTHVRRGTRAAAHVALLERAAAEGLSLREIVISDPAVASMQVSGQFRSGEAERFARRGGNDGNRQKQRFHTLPPHHHGSTTTLTFLMGKTT